MGPFTNLEIIGLVFSALFLLCILKKLWTVLYRFCIGPIFNKVNIKSYGKWALITGSTDGIGKEYARQLAERGCNIVLVSRSMDKLKTVAQEIENEFKVETKVVAIDFTSDVSIYQKLADEIKGLEIGTLVNNVGLYYPYPEYFLDIPDWDKVMDNLVNVNIVSMIRVTGAVLPDMVRRGKGIVINVGSSASEIPIPLVQVYGAVKAFTTKFSEGLRFEYGSQGILVQHLTPGYVVTKMSKLEKTSFIAPSPKDYVKSALNLLGTAHETNGYFAHSLMITTIKFICGISENLIVSATKRTMEESKINALKELK